MSLLLVQAAVQMVARSAQLPAEFSGAVVRSMALPLEFSGSVIRMGSLPVEFLGALAREGFLPVETLVGLARSGLFPMETLGALVREGLLPVEFQSAAFTSVIRDVLLPIDFTAAPQLFFNWIAAGGGAPVWWREYPTPAYPNKAPATPEEHLRDRTRRRRRRKKAPATVAEVQADALGFKALIRLHRRRYHRAMRVARPPTVIAEVVRHVESDEEFLILTGRL